MMMTWDVIPVVANFLFKNLFPAAQICRLKNK